ncbi:hypothetical protein P4U65_27330 [Bacillus pacificus]|nr:hypothetical protein [Bacillus thuringiensis]MED1304177.1 hypothetical protein [Bacillus pacificus]
MKKILVIIPALLVAGALIISPVAEKDQKSTAATSEGKIVLYANDPGVGW